MRRLVPGANGAHVGLHGRRLGVPVEPRERERAIDDEPDLAPGVRRDRGELGRGERRHLHDHVRLAVRLVDAPPRDEPEHRHAECEQIRARVDVLAEDLLGRHVRERAEHRPGLRVERRRGALAHARDAEVEHLEPAVGHDEQVVGLDVAVDDPLCVRRREHVEELVGEAQEIGQRHGALLGARREALALEQLHHEERRAVLGDVDVVDLDGAGVTKFVRGLRLALEALAQIAILRERGVQDLDRLAPADLVATDVHGRHPAHAEETLELPFPAQHRADAPFELFAFVHPPGGSVAKRGSGLATGCRRPRRRRPSRGSSASNRPIRSARWSA